MKAVLAALALVLPSCMARRDASGWSFKLDIANAAKAIRVMNQK